MALAGRPRGKRPVLKQNPSGLSPHMWNDDGFRCALPILRLLPELCELALLRGLDRTLCILRQ
jgi:hypothetical protein